MQTVEQLKGIGDVMMRLGDLRKAQVIHDAVKLCTVWHKASDELPEKDGTYLAVGRNGNVHTAYYYTGAGRFSNRSVRWWAELPMAPEVRKHE